MIDPTLQSYNNDELEVISEVIQDCIQSDPRLRPTMNDIVSKLRGVINVSPEQAVPRLSPLWWAELEILSLEANWVCCSIWLSSSAFCKSQSISRKNLCAIDFELVLLFTMSYQYICFLQFFCSLTVFCKVFFWFIPIAIHIVIEVCCIVFLVGWCWLQIASSFGCRISYLNRVFD